MRLASSARVVVESFAPGRLRQLGLEPALRDAIVVSIWEAAGGGLFGPSATEHVSAGSRNVN